jgi:hypothetical protein
MNSVLSGPSSRFALPVLAAAFALVVAVPTATAQTPVTAEALEGVWRVTKVVSPDGTANLSPQPGLTILYRGYFTIIRDNGNGPRPQAPAPKDPANLTEAEKAALYQEWASFGAMAGTYEIKGDTLVTRNEVAKMVQGVGRVEQAIVALQGNTFTAQAKPGEPNAGRVTTYTRVR